MIQSGLTASDLAGLNPEDVASLLGNAQAFGSDRQAAMNLLYDERIRQQERQDAIAAAAAAREQKFADRKEEIIFKRFEDMKESDAEIAAAKALAKSREDLATHKAELDAEADKLTDNEKEIKELEIKELEATVDNIEADIAQTKAETEQVGVPEVDPITPTEQIALDKQVKAEHDVIVFGSYKDDKGNDIKVSFETRKAYALQANNRLGNPIYYFITEPQEVEGWFNDIPGKIKPIYLDRGPNGEQITSQHIIDTAKAEGITEEEVLKIIGAI